MEINLTKDWLLLSINSNPIHVNLPYDAMIHEKRFQQCISGEESAFFPGGKYIYKKEFELKKEDNHYFALRFEGVYRNAVIKLNGHQVYENKYGFSEFVIDISNQIQDKNILEVIVDNSLTPNARFYTGSGIYRPVILIVKKEKQIDEVRVSTLDYETGLINIKIKAKEEGYVTIFDKNNQIVYEGKLGNIIITNPHLWSDFNPYLYKAIISTSLDKEEVCFGIRTVQYASNKGLLINGKETKLRGACLHSDNGILGAASYRDYEYEKVRKLKEAGFNAIRSSHNPCSSFILEACDYYGVYLIDELYDGWYVPKNYHDHARDFSKDEYQKDIRVMINKDYNHPSVILYSLGNEVSEVAHQKGLDVLSEMVKYCHKLDGTRKVTCGINLLICVYEQLGLGIYKDKNHYQPIPLEDKKIRKMKKSGSTFFNYWTQKLGKIIFIISKGRRAEKIAKDVAERLDIIGLNYGSARYDIDYKKYPDRLMMGTETFISEAPHNYKMMSKIPNLIGDFIWVGFDYLGEAGFGDWTYYSYGGLPLTYGSGVFDILGNKTTQLSYLQVVWGIKKEPVIAVRPVNHYYETPKVSAWKFTDAIENYNFHGYEGKKMVVEVYSNASFIKLLQNNKLIGIKKVKNNVAYFKGKYHLGFLKAVALDENKKEINYSVLSSKDNNPHIYVSISNNVISTKNGEIIFGSIEIRNDGDQLLPCYEEEISISLSDNLSLLAFGSALSNNKEDYHSHIHHAYRGAIGFVIAAKEKGEGIIIVKGKDLKDVEIKILIKEEM